MKSILKPDTIYITYENDVYVRVFAEPGITQEISNLFTFEVPGFRFMPKFRSKLWDGRIRLYTSSGRLYTGLIYFLEKYANSHDYTIIKTGFPEAPKTDNLEKSLDQLIIDLNIHKKDKKTGQFYKIDVYPEQRTALLHAIKTNRAVLVSPTASGKSLIIYILYHWFKKQLVEQNKKFLIIVPKISLVEQMYKDFDEYAHAIKWSSKNNFHRIYAGHEKETKLPGIVSTWQSIHKLPKSWFSKIGAVIGDEAHTFQAQSLTKIMNNLEKCPLRIGATGSIQDEHETKVHRLVLEGVFGPVFTVTTTKELIDKGRISNLLVKCLMLNYPEEIKQKIKSYTYDDEMKFLQSYVPRNKFIRDLVWELKGNTLLFFKIIDHGKELYKLLEEKNKKSEKKRKIFFIYGKTPVEAREKAREITEKETDAILVASFGTFREGINIDRLHNTVDGCPLKSPIWRKQSIGRGLRKAEGKTKLTHYDIADDLCYKTHKNTAWKHFLYRLNIYKQEQFDQKMYKFNLL